MVAMLPQPCGACAMKTHHLYSTAMILAAAAMISAQPLSAQTISGTQTKAVNMTEGKLTVTGTGFLNVEKTPST